MEKMKQIFSGRFFRIFKWIFFVIIGFYVVLVLGRAFYFLSEDRTEAQVAKIHATKLTMDDVMGKFLPPDPGSEADKTLEGVDVNENGIRDDVELAIFEKYPKSPKTRAALLQYALALQMEFTQPFINTAVADKIIGEESRAYGCIADSLVPRKNPESERSDAQMNQIDSFYYFVENLQINNQNRKQARKDFYKKMGKDATSTKQEECDIDYSKLLN